MGLLSRVSEWELIVRDPLVNPWIGEGHLERFSFRTVAERSNGSTFTFPVNISAPHQATQKPALS